MSIKADDMYMFYYNEIKNRKILINQVPEEYRTSELYKLAIKKRPISIRNIRNPDDELKEFTIRTSPFMIRFIDNPSTELQTMAINIKPYAIKGIRNPSYELCKYALLKHPGVFTYIPEELIDEELAFIGVSIKGFGYNLKDVPTIFKTKDICEIAVKSNGCAINYVPEELRTVEMRLVAVRDRGHYIQYIENQTFEIKMEAVLNNPRAIEYVIDPEPEHIIAVIKHEQTKKGNLKKTVSILTTKIHESLMDNGYLIVWI